MTGAQERALARLKKSHRDLCVSAKPKPGEDVVVSWTRKTDWGIRTSIARVTPEGRLVEVSTS